MRLLRNTRVSRHRSGTVLFVKVVPKSATLTSLECSLFGRNSSELESVAEELKKVVARDIGDLVSTQRKLLRDHAVLSDSTVVDQEEISQILKDHTKAENKAGMEIHPAARSQHFTLEGKADDDCK